MPDQDAMIAHGERSGAWPTAVRFDDLLTAGGLKAPGRAVVATYASHPEACLSVVGDRYRATTADEWRLALGGFGMPPAAPWRVTRMAIGHLDSTSHPCHGGSS